MIKKLQQISILILGIMTLGGLQLSPVLGCTAYQGQSCATNADCCDELMCSKDTAGNKVCLPW